jgi:cell division transport system permease protein
MSRLRLHIQLFGSTLRRVVAQPLGSLLNVAVIGIALALPVGFYVLVDNLERFSRQVSGEPQLSVFLSLDVSSAEVSALEQRLKALPGSKQVQFVRRATALENLRRDLGDVLDNLQGNPLPDAFIVVANSTVPGDLEAMRNQVRRWPKVTHVQLDSDWARRLDAVLKLGRTMAQLLTGLLAVGLVAVTFNTIRLQILTRLEEIEVARLIGATDDYVRRPFLYFGATQGLLGGMAAWGMVALSIVLLNLRLADIGAAYATELRLSPLGVEDAATLLVFSTLLGLLGAWMSVSRHLWAIQPK